MSQFIEPPPLNDPIVSDTTGRIKSTPWVLWLNGLADAISAGILDNTGTIQTTVVATTTLPQLETVSDIAVYNYDVQSTSTNTSSDIETLYWTGV